MMAAWRCRSLGAVVMRLAHRSVRLDLQACPGGTAELSVFPGLKPWAESSCPFGALRSIPAVHVQKNFLRVPKVSLVGLTKHGSRGKTGKGPGPLTFEVKPQAPKKQ